MDDSRISLRRSTRGLSLHSVKLLLKYSTLIMTPFEYSDYAAEFKKLGLWYEHRLIGGSPNFGEDFRNCRS